MTREVIGICLIFGFLIVLLVLTDNSSKSRKKMKKPIYGRNIGPDLNGHRWMIVEAEFIDLDEEERKLNEQ